MFKCRVLIAADDAVVAFQRVASTSSDQGINFFEETKSASFLDLFCYHSTDILRVL